MDTFEIAMLERWMDNATLAAIGKPYLDVHPGGVPTYATYSYKSAGKVEGYFDRTTKTQRIYVEFEIYSSVGAERDIRTILADTVFNLASFSLDDGIVSVMKEIGTTRPNRYAGVDPTSKKAVYATSILFEALTERFISTP